MDRNVIPKIRDKGALRAMVGLGKKSAMHLLFAKADSLTENVIGAAIEVHKHLGPGLIETLYEWGLGCELGLRRLAFQDQQVVRINYKGNIRQESLRLDVLVENCLLIEAKAVDAILPIHKAQLLSYMKLLNIPIGLLINFNTTRLSEGVHRLILSGANK